MEEAVQSIWGKFHIPRGSCGRWRIGPLHLIIERQEYEWRLGTLRERESFADTMGVLVPARPPDDREPYYWTRYGTTSPDLRLDISPRLPDRSVVTRPAHAFAIPPQDEVRIFVTSPVWIRLAPGADGARRLADFPIYRPSDTWFGPPTQEGHLCYASRTYCCLHLSEFVLQRHRATTAVRIQNRTDSTLVLERISLPVFRLALFQTPNGVLWTEETTLVRRDVTDFADVKVARRPPPEAERAKFISPSRRQEDGPFRAFSSLLR
ncbi:MAG: hypothetical protein ACFB9M_19395 [Myxococcota bacterium]